MIPIWNCSIRRETLGMSRSWMRRKENMASHFDCCSASIALCDQLRAALSAKLPDLRTENGPNKCSFEIVRGGRKFAWVNSHSKKSGRLNIFFRAGKDWQIRLRQCFALTFSPRGRPPEGHWGDFPGSFSIETQEQIKQAAEFLATVSCPASL